MIVKLRLRNILAFLIFNLFEKFIVNDLKIFKCKIIKIKITNVYRHHEYRVINLILIQKVFKTKVKM